jgi:hypothetical protein
VIASRVARRVRSTVRRPARTLLTPGPTTAPLLHPVGPEVPDDRHLQQVIDLCMRIGEVLLSSGEGSGDTTEAMLRVAGAFGLWPSTSTSPPPPSPSAATAAWRPRRSPRCGWWPTAGST